MQSRLQHPLPKLIGPSDKLRATMRLANERAPISYEAAKRQVDRIQALSSPQAAPLPRAS